MAATNAAALNADAKDAAVEAASEADSLRRYEAGEAQLVCRVLVGDCETPVAAYLKLHDPARGQLSCSNRSRVARRADATR